MSRSYDAAYAQAGGQAGTGMTLAQFNQQMASIYGNGPGPLQTAQKLGVPFVGALQKPQAGQTFAGAGTNVITAGSDPFSAPPGGKGTDPQRTRDVLLQHLG